MSSVEQTRQEIRDQVGGTTVNQKTLLSTDYANHLGEVVMTIGMIADMPDLIAEAKAWQPKSYEAHFEDSGLRVGPLAIQAYEVSEAKFREPFDEEISVFNDCVAAGCPKLEAAIETNDAEYISFAVNDLSQKLQKIMDRIAAIANGAMLEEVTVEEAEGSMSQDDIDALF